MYLLSVSVSQTVTYCGGRFAVAAANLWNRYMVDSPKMGAICSPRRVIKCVTIELIFREHILHTFEHQTVNLRIYIYIYI